MTIEIIEEVMPGTSVIEEIVNLELSVIEGDTAAAEAAAAAAAASAASASGSASTATTQAGIATTKAQEAGASATAAETAKTGAETAETNAETAQAGAEAARDEITDKVVFTGIEVGDLLQAVDVSGVVKLVRVSPVELLKPLQPLSQSALFADSDMGQIIAWDNSFGKPNENPRTTSDSGHTYTRLSGTGNFQVINGKFQKTERNDIFIIDTGVYGSMELKTWFKLVNNSREMTFIIGKDNSNYIMYQIGVVDTVLNAIISGVSNNVYTVNTANLFSENNELGGAARSQNKFIDLSFSLYHNVLKSAIGASVRSVAMPFLNRSFDLISYISTFPTDSDITFAGWGGGFSQNNRGISSWRIKSLL